MTKFYNREVATSSKEKACLAIILALGTKKKIKRSIWMKEWLKKRDRYSHVNLLREMSANSEDYRNYFRMDSTLFNMLVNKVAPYISRKNTVMRESITAHERVALTLRFLATGRSFEDLKFSAIMSTSVISQAVLETCNGRRFRTVYIQIIEEPSTCGKSLFDYLSLLWRMYEVRPPQYIYLFQMPTTPEDWKLVSNEFEAIYKIKNCVGAIDGKHVAIEKPPNFGSTYYKYKHFYSIVLLAVVSAKKKFLMVDVGTNGRISDGGVMFHSKFGEQLNSRCGAWRRVSATARMRCALGVLPIRANLRSERRKLVVTQVPSLLRQSLQTGELNLPPPSPMPHSSGNFPFVFVADEAFSLHTNVMKPYAKKDLNHEKQVVSNQIMSSARSVVENTFGILVARFRVLLTTMNLDPNNIGETITMDRCPLSQIQQRTTSQAKTVRDNYAEYYYSQER
ncbi:LOW QUALITY PROTEIN: uncharacterized protein LOC143211103 [Lasioglossum baleicum]|uniref:LOW QUALITY PROTEIN: uncharacterized protein LOC143211103 n=1 Tax=Lasioglossum baleicum TaxID=434251 RepID=UPI003FCE5BE1